MDSAPAMGSDNTIDCRSRQTAQRQAKRRWRLPRDGALLRQQGVPAAGDGDGRVDHQLGGTDLRRLGRRAHPRCPDVRHPAARQQILLSNPPAPFRAPRARSNKPLARCPISPAMRVRRASLTARRSCTCKPPRSRPPPAPPAGHPAAPAGRVGRRAAGPAGRSPACLRQQ